jgi:hypothetical protein
VNGPEIGRASCPCPADCRVHARALAHVSSPCLPSSWLASHDRARVPVIENGRAIAYQSLRVSVSVSVRASSFAHRRGLVPVSSSNLARWTSMLMPRRRKYQERRRRTAQLLNQPQQELPALPRSTSLLGPSCVL